MASYMLPITIIPILRRLAHAPSFTAMALLTIAIGIGANATIFAVVENVVLKPLSFYQPENLVSVRFASSALKMNDLPASPSAYFVYREQGHAFSDIGLWTEDSFNLTRRREPEQVHGVDVTYTLPLLLGIHPVLGRSFDAKDDSPNAPLTTLVSFSVWKQKFAGDLHVIGQRIRLDGKLYEVIGVLPEHLHFFDQHPAFFVPLQLDRAKTHIGSFSYFAIARLKPGVSSSQAAQDAQRLLAIQFRTFPAPAGYTVQQFQSAGISPRLQPLSKQLVGDVGATLWVLMGTIGLVLLIACANVANLLLVRTDGRQQELAIRAALGASSFRLSLDLLVESLLLGLTGGVLGLGLAFGALRALIGLAPANLPRLDEITIDGRVTLFTLAISLGAGLLFGLFPVLKYAIASIQPALRQGGRNASASRERNRARQGLVILQVALAVVLLISSGLMIRTIRALTQVNSGVRDPATLQTLQIWIPETTIKSHTMVLRAQQSILQAISEIPGVASAAIGRSVPMAGHMISDPVFAEDHVYNGPPPIFRYEFTAPGFFKTLGSRLIAGRDYDWQDLYNHHPVAILSDGLARQLFGNAQHAIGKRVRQNLKAPWLQVIGVAPDLRSDGLSKPAPLTAYWPFLQDDVQRSGTLVVRSARAGSQAFVDQIRHAIWSVNGAVPVGEVSTEQALIDRSMARTSFTLVLLSVAAFMALVLGVVGLYGVIAYSVSQRTREIGVRLAVGAQPRQVMALFLRSALGLTTAGLVLGMLLASLAMRLLTSILFGVTPVDPITYVTGAVALMLAALLASYLPTRRIIGIDPAIALRND